MLFKNKKQNKGLSLNETVIAISIIIFVFVIGFKPFIAMNERRSLDEAVKNIENLLEEARNSALTTNFYYGVQFEEDKATLFKGNSFYLLNEENKTVNLKSDVVISDILIGGGKTVIFNGFDGSTNQPGKIKISTVSETPRFKIITIFLNGNFVNE